VRFQEASDHACFRTSLRPHEAMPTGKGYIAVLPVTVDDLPSKGAWSAVY
jgi:hypothetical protein